MPEVNHNPDVLTCLANLSNDEVFTPPEVANALLDLIPDDLWKDPDVKVLDPACKSGVFLREAAKRFLKGEEEVIPDLKERIDHIFHKQLFGYAITELTSQLSRRTVYCSKTANGKYSVTPFKSESGNIAFSRVEHRWVDGKCSYCGASQDVFDRGADAETHAYKFIHLAPQQIKELYMKFDLIIGNPPYQLDTKGAGRQAKPIYNLFVDKAKQLKPKYITMIIPSRWFAGGMGLDDFREEMSNDSHITQIVDYTNAKDCFPSNSVSGGVCYFLWERDKADLCNFTNITNGVKDTLKRSLSEFPILVRYNKAISIIHKVQNQKEECIDTIVSGLMPFGLSTSYRGCTSQFKKALLLHSSEGVSYIKESEIRGGEELVDKYKILISKTSAEHAGEPSKDGKFRVISSSLKVITPKEICTHSYFVLGKWNNRTLADNALTYLQTRFVRFLMLMCLSGIGLSKQSFKFVPIQDFSKSWTDKELDEKYNLSTDEIKFIESMIKPME